MLVVSQIDVYQSWLFFLILVIILDLSYTNFEANVFLAI